MLFSIGEFFELVYNEPLLYSENMIFVIDQMGRAHQAMGPFDLSKYDNCTIKIEKMEKYNSAIYQYGQKLAKKYHHNGPVTCHAFYSNQGGYSFPLHTDPDDVIILCCDGIKTIETDIHNEIHPNETLLIPANTPHKATNKYESLMLSFGLEKFIVEKLNHGLVDISKNNRDL